MNTLYLENDWSGTLPFLSLGLSVHARESPPIEEESCLKAEKLDQEMNFCSNSLAQKYIQKMIVFEIGKLQTLDLKNDIFINWNPLSCPI